MVVFFKQKDLMNVHLGCSVDVLNSVQMTGIVTGKYVVTMDVVIRVKGLVEVCNNR